MSESLFIGLAQNVALLLALVVVFDTIGPHFSSGAVLLRKTGLGLVLGAIGLGVMLTPMILVPGVVFDTRSVLLGISGLFFGSLPTIMAMVITAAFRFYQGGSGALTGVLVIAATGSLGILWRKLCRHPVEETRWLEFYLFGVVSHLVMLALMFTLPRGIALKVVASISAPVLALYPLCTVFLGLLLSKRVQREHATATLRESEERLRLTTAILQKNEVLLSRSQEIAHIGTWVLDPASGHLTWTDEVYRIFGLVPQEFKATYEAFIGMIHPDDRVAVSGSYARSVSERKDGYEIEHRIIRRSDGEIRYVHEKCLNERDAAGTVTRSIGMVQDITERHLANQKVQESETALKRLLDEAERSRRALLSVIEDRKKQ